MIKEIEKLPYFKLEHLDTFIKNKNNSKVYVSRWLKSGEIISIKKWFYVSFVKINEINFANNYNLFVSYLATNIIYVPSYLSLEYILFRNNIITENVYSITLITTKKTTVFNNNFWNFSYRNIKEDLFWWYKFVKDWELFYYEAIVEKALLDFFWLKKDIVFDESYFKELRLNLEWINFKKLNNFAKKFKSKKIDKILTFLIKIKW